jgi:hypothetical protein
MCSRYGPSTHPVQTMAQVPAGLWTGCIGKDETIASIAVAKRATELRSFAFAQIHAALHIRRNTENKNKHDNKHLGKAH